MSWTLVRRDSRCWRDGRYWIVAVSLATAAACSASPGSSSSGSGGSLGGSGGAGPGTGGDGTGGGDGGGASGTPKLVTSAQNAYWSTSAQWTEVSSNADVTVNDGTENQTWEGFGGAFNEKGWVALSALDEGERSRAINLLFGDDGARFVMGRIPIGASDYAIDRYTLDDQADDTDLKAFSIERDTNNLIPYIEAAMAVRPGIRFWASPWTPPPWMKTGMKSGKQPSPYDGGTMKDDDTILKAHAQYFIKFIGEYGKKGITIEAVAPQNEPNYDQNYPSCLWPTALFTKFVGKYLGPAFDDAGVTTKIMLGTMSNGSADPAIVSNVMGNADAKKYIKVIGMQWGMQSHVGEAKGFGVPIWQTEHVAGNCPFGGASNCATVSSSKAPNDHAYGVETWNLIRDWIKTGVTSYSAWNMVLDTSGLGIDTTRNWNQDSLLAVDTGARSLIVTPAYQVFRHVSRFVEPGAKVVGTSGGDAIAFKNPNGGLVAVIFNSGGGKKLTVAIGGKKLQFDMPGNGWATVNYQP